MTHKEIIEKLKNGETIELDMDSAMSALDYFEKYHKPYIASFKRDDVLVKLKIDYGR